MTHEANTELWERSTRLPRPRANGEERARPPPACRAGSSPSSGGNSQTPPLAQTAPSHSGMMQGQLQALLRSQLLTSSSNEVSSKMTARGSLRATVSPSYSGVTCPSEHQPISWRDTSEPPNTPEVPLPGSPGQPLPSPSNCPPPRAPR